MTTTTSKVGRALLQRRVANLGLVLALIGLAFVAMRVAAVLAVGRPQRLVHASMISHYLGVGASVAMWLSCRSGEHPKRRIQIIELVGLFVVCSLYAVMAVGIPQAFRPEMTLLLAFGVFLLGHAVHVPSSWRWTALLGTSLAIPLIAGAWVILVPMDPRLVEASASARGSVQTSADAIIGIGMASVATWWVVIVATASSVSAVIYGLRRDVRAARQLGQYTLEEKLGQGGMGVVYRATHAMLRRATAIKLLLPELVGEEAVARFEREVQTTARLSHPNTVRIFDYGRTADGLFYYAMELLEGASLAEVVAEDGPMPPARVAHVLHQVAGALAEAHALGLIHRDIKPANVMLTNHGGLHDHAVVVDFGLVKQLDDGGDASMSATGTIIGTPMYLSPEVIRGAAEDGPARDLYALGCVAYFLLTGHDVFTGPTPVEVCAKHLALQPEAPSKRLGQPIPDELEALVLQLLAKEVEARPASALEVLERLEQSPLYGAWRREDAAKWWDGPGRALREHEPAPAHSLGSSATLAIDFQHRRA
ncbi:MAG: serine/threonine-protein kinase [Polyangiaceae bacterium]